MSTIDSDTVKKMADLSRIHLTNQEVDTFSHQLDDIVNFVSQLPDTTTNPEPSNWLRLDADAPRTHTGTLLSPTITDQAGNVVVKAILNRNDE